MEFIAINLDDFHKNQKEQEPPAEAALLGSF